MREADRWGTKQAARGFVAAMMVVACSVGPSSGAAFADEAPAPYRAPYGFRLPSAAPALLPRVIDYSEGMSIPPGYDHVIRNRRGLVVGGGVLVGVLYGITFMGGIVSLLDGQSEYAVALVPGFGPLALLGTVSHIDAGWKTLFLVDGLAQLAGGAMLIAGVAVKEDVLVRKEAPKKTDTSALSFSVGPGSASLRLRF